NAERPYLFGRTMSTCAVHDGLCYAADYDGYLYCLDARSGEKFWEHDLKADTWGSPYWVDGKIYIGNENGRMHIFQHGKTKKLLGQISMRANSGRATQLAGIGALSVTTETPCNLCAIGAKK